MCILYMQTKRRLSHRAKQLTTNLFALCLLAVFVSLQAGFILLSYKPPPLQIHTLYYSLRPCSTTARGYSYPTAMIIVLHTARE
jgi:hypothetical protein